MRMHTTWLAAVMLTPTSVAGADLKSGPAVGDKVTALKVYAATGANADKDVDYAALRDGKPTVYLFVSAEHWDRPIARLVKTVDTSLPEASAQAEAVAVWLTDKADEAKDYLPKVQQSLRLQTTALTVFTGVKAGPADWNINGEASITIAVVHQNKVAAVFAHRTVADKDAAAVIDAVRKAVGAK
jgi:hypothetical protein